MHFINCFFSKPLDLQPVSSLLHEWIDNSCDPDKRVPKIHCTMQYMADAVCAFVQCLFNRPFNLQPVCDVVHRWIDTTPDLSESERSVIKYFTECAFTLMRKLFNERIFVVIPDPDPSFPESRMWPEIQGFFSRLLFRQKIRIRFKILKCTLRKSGICVYTY